MKYGIQDNTAQSARHGTQNVGHEIENAKQKIWKSQNVRHETWSTILET